MVGSSDQKLHTAPSPLVERFLGAVQSGNVSAVANLLMEDSTWIGDGGGVKPATMRPVVGADKVARGLTSLLQKFQDQNVSYRPVMANGGLGLEVALDGELDALYLFLGTDTHITHVLTVRNPYKLTGIEPRDSN